MAVTPEDLAALRARYPAMVDLNDESATYWLTEAQRIVGDTWNESDRAPAQLAYAAHMASVTGGLTGTADAQGVTSFKSGSFSMSQTDAAASRTGFDATIYGREFLLFRAASFRGPRVY